MLFAVVLCAATTSACAPESEPGRTSDAAIAGDSPAAGSAAVDTGVITTRTAVLLSADSATLERMRAEHGEDFYTVADDLMWYRAEAWSWLEARGIPILAIEGRPPLRFRVAGTARTFDFFDHPTADLVILYDSDRAPLAVAPIDVSAVAHTYFPDLPTPVDPGER